MKKYFHNQIVQEKVPNFRSCEPKFHEDLRASENLLQEVTRKSWFLSFSWSGDIT